MKVKKNIQSIAVVVGIFVLSFFTSIDQASADLVGGAVGRDYHSSLELSSVSHGQTFQEGDVITFTGHQEQDYGVFASYQSAEICAGHSGNCHPAGSYHPPASRTENYLDRGFPACRYCWSPPVRKLDGIRQCTVSFGINRASDPNRRFNYPLGEVSGVITKNGLKVRCSFSNVQFTIPSISGGGNMVASVYMVLNGDDPVTGVPGHSNSGNYGEHIVIANPNNAPIAHIITPTSNQIVTQGTQINFNGSGSDPDPGDGISIYEWREGSCHSGTVLRASTANAAFSKNNFSVGSHTVYLRVRDNNGAWSTNCPSRRITVQESSPTLTFTADSANISHGGSTNLRWNTTNATNCVATNGTSSWQSNSKATASSGESTGSLTSDTTFTLTCTGPGGTVGPQSVTVNVAACTPTYGSPQCINVTSPGACTNATCGQTLSGTTKCVKNRLPGCSEGSSVIDAPGECSGGCSIPTVDCPACKDGNWREVNP